ncbi:TPA: FprA family A-type flavoprotein [bacterium]|nr:FprA family A-type flavoprotein [bacterium]
MKAIKIKDDIYFVGAFDFNLRNFHGLDVETGTTYGAYLIIDEKVTLIDAVKPGFENELISRISSVIDPKKIDVIIANHGEPDHSGTVKFLHELAPKAKIYASVNGEKSLKGIFGDDLPVIAVKNGETLNIGKRTLTFYHTQMVHWPDNMVTYSEFDKVLFSNDVFGQHFAPSKLFDSFYPKERILYEAKKYYVNIVNPYNKMAKKALEALGGLDIELIATAHGVIFKDYIPDVKALYASLVNNEKQNKAVVVYDSMWGSTKLMAKAIAEAFIEKGIQVHLFNVNESDQSIIFTEVVDAKYLAIGSPTFNNGILPSIAGFLTYIKGLLPQNMKTIAFGSYGWGGQSPSIIEKELKEIGLEPLVPPIKQYFSTHNEDFDRIKQTVIEALDQIV